MKEHFEQATRRKITSGTKEWADFNVNCVKGCYNDCRYCYAKMMAKRFGRNERTTWRNMKIREDVLRKNFKKLPGRVMFPSTHDIFDISPFKEVCFIVLRKLLESRNEVLITTKPKLTIIQGIDHEFCQFKEQIQFRFTLTSINDELLKFWEPNAPRFKERLTSLEYAFSRGFKTSVSIEPFLDYDPAELIETITPFTTESIWIGRMNYISRKNLSKEEKPHYNRIRKNYETSHLWEIFNKLNGHPRIKFKDSIKIQLGIETNGKCVPLLTQECARIRIPKKYPKMVH
jgi:DNA repair photolyase